MSDCLGARRYRVRPWGEYGSQADRDEGRRQDGLTSLEIEELRELRRENRQLRRRARNLRQVAAWFARETGTIPGRSSRS